MELYTFDIEGMQSDYKVLLDLYHKATSEFDRYNIYLELLHLKRLDKRLSRNEGVSKIIPSTYKKIAKNSENKKLNFYLQLDELTRELCYYWTENLRSLEELNINKSKLSENIITHFEYYDEIVKFIAEKMPDDLRIVTNTFKKCQIRVRNSSIKKPSADIFYLEQLKKYYINILCRKALTIFDVGVAIHEFGHASSFMKSGKWDPKDYILKETIASLYEILFIEYYLEGKRKDLKLRELGHLFKSIGVYHLKNYFESVNESNNTYLYYLDIVDSLYSHIIAMTIIAKSNSQEEIDTKMSYIKSNAPFARAFPLLGNIGITEEDLIDTSKHVRQIILKNN